MVDLHTHSIFSDGNFTPSEVVDKAYGKGIRFLALTDHDTVGGIPEFLEASKKYKDLHPIIGCEVSVRFTDVEEIHILALGIKKMESFDRFVQRARYIRGWGVIERIKKLQQNGFDISFDDVLNCETFKGTLTNEHTKNVMIRKGLTSDDEIKEKKYWKSIAHFNIYGLFPKFDEAIKAIHDAGAIAVIAHPYKLELRDSVLFELIKKFKEKGLDGIECYHSNHSLEETEKYLTFAKELGMLVTGGSDHHGKKDQLHKDYGKSNRLEKEIPHDLIEKLPLF